MLKIYYIKNVNREYNDEGEMINKEEFDRYWNMTNPGYDEKPPKPRKEEYELKGEFPNAEGNANKVYELCQNGIGQEKPFEGRSMMVGDLVEVNGQLYICAPVGFEKTEWE